MTCSSRSRLWIILALLLTLIGGYVIYWACFMREHRQWSDDLKLWNGERLHVQCHMSRKVLKGRDWDWWSTGPWQYDKIAFTIDGKRFQWEGSYTPIAIQPDVDGVVYIVASDRQSEESRHRLSRMFRIYRSRSDGLWDEIAPAKFPKHLAIQNSQCSGLSRDGDDDRSDVLDVIERMDPAEREFRYSLNGELWVFLEDPNGKNIYPREGFFRDFKSKWIRPIRSEHEAPERGEGGMRDTSALPRAVSESDL